MYKNSNITTPSVLRTSPPIWGRHLLVRMVGQFNVIILLFILLLFSFAVSSVDAAVDFTQEIKPILENNCIVCHGAGDVSADFSLASQKLMMRGGLSGQAVVPGDADKSYLVQLIEHTAKPHMPYNMPKLADDEIALIRKWIDEGAVYDAPIIDGLDDDFEDALEQKKDLWSIKPIRDVIVPDVDSDWVQNPVDAFVLKTLREKNLSPSKQADYRTMIRRLTVTLHGLLPTADEVERYVRDGAADKYERLVERLLESPRYGEHWGQHWLDITKYADTYGYDQDIKRPYAWRYRDYVIDSFNEDKPYPQFIKEQIAGDVLNPDEPGAAVATGFLTTGPWDNEAAGSSPMIQKKFRMDQLDDILTTVMTSTVGVTVNCARCHDHKFDPISQKEYYQLAAVFAGTQYGDRVISRIDEEKREQLIEPIDTRLRYVHSQLNRLQGMPIHLADIVSGGNGYGSGDVGRGINPLNGNMMGKRTERFRDARANEIVRAENLFVDSIFVPDGGDGEEVALSSTGIVVNDLPDTSGETWGTVHVEELEDEVDGSLVEIPAVLLHANKGITFDFQYLRTEYPDKALKEFVCGVRLSEESKTEIRIYLDGEPVSIQTEQKVVIPLKNDSRFLTFVATDGGDGISEDFVYLIDPQISTETVITKTPQEIKVQFAWLKQEIAVLEEERERIPNVEYAFANITQEPHDVDLLRRGDLNSPVEEVSPGTVGLFKGLPQVFGDPDLPEGERRLALAKWITHPNNVLMKRVIVNRIWQHLIGQGIVATPSDFGHNGSLPTHPELLDWLANEFEVQGWSIKRLIKEIVLSAVFQQESVNRDDGVNVDSGNRWLWRMNPRRMNAESIRDSILLVSGNLNVEMGGPGFEPFDFEDKFSPDYHYYTENSPEHWRRSVYRFVVRSKPNQFMAVFDCPNPTNLSPVRSSTTTPLQPLAMMNNEFVLLQARYLSKQIKRNAGDGINAQVAETFRRVLMRDVNVTEKLAAKRLVEKHGLKALCRMMFNANEFVYTD